jgi:sulfate transport system ATP-binding protein
MRWRARHDNQVERMSITISDLSRRYDSFTALDAISLEVGTGEFVALLGPSGSGKTTLLRILAGLDQPDQGQVLRDGEDLLALEAQHRGIGMVFQHYALFAHMRVAENIAFGLRVRKRAQRPGKAQIQARVDELLRRVQLEDIGGRYPAQLSGGQRQRVALARALAIEPSLLLLDEPFGALDAQVRVTLRGWLRELQRALGLTTVFVTHDQEEALEMADRVVVMNQGRIEQVGTPEQIYRQPRTPFVHGFIGRSSRLQGRVVEGQLQLPGLRVAGPLPAALEGHEVSVWLRPEQVALQPAGGQAWPMQVRYLRQVGALTRASLFATQGWQIEAEWSSEQVARHALHEGATVQVQPRELTVFEHPVAGAAHVFQPQPAAAGE